MLICTGSGPVQMDLPAGDDGPRDGRMPCAFALAQMAAALPAAVVVSEAPQQAARQPPIPPAAAVITRAPRLFQARASPLPV